MMDSMDVKFTSFNHCNDFILNQQYVNSFDVFDDNYFNR